MQTVWASLLTVKIRLLISAYTSQTNLARIGTHYLLSVVLFAGRPGRPERINGTSWWIKVITVVWVTLFAIVWIHLHWISGQTACLLYWIVEIFVVFSHRLISYLCQVRGDKLLATLQLSRLTIYMSCRSIFGIRSSFKLIANIGLILNWKMLMLYL